MTSQSFEVCLPSAANGLPFAEISDLRRMGIMAIDSPDAGNPFNSSEALRAIQELGGDSTSLQQACDAATFLQSWHPGGDRVVADTLVRDHGWEHSRAKAAMRLVVLVERTPLFNALGDDSGAPEPTSRDSGQRHETEKPLDDAPLSSKPESVRADNAPSSAELVGTDATAMSAPQPEKAPPSSMVPRKPGVVKRNRNAPDSVRPIPERAKPDGAAAAQGRLPCIGEAELFTESKGREILTAKELCFGCKEQADCAAKALAKRELFGVLGGLAPAERRKIHAQAKTVITQAHARLDGAYPKKLYLDLLCQKDSLAYPVFIGYIVKLTSLQKAGGDLFKPITEALSDEEIIDTALQQAFEAYDREQQRNTKRIARLAILASLEDESVAS